MKLHLGLLLASSCAFSMHSSGFPGSSSSSSSTPTTSSETAPEASRADAEPVAVTAPVPGPPVLAPVGAAAAATWSGTYAPGSGPACDGRTPFDPRGPDVQTVRLDDWDYAPGFRCPGGCTNTTKLTVANGKAAFPLIWVDDQPPYQGGKYTVTMHRMRVDIPLGKLDATHVGATATYASAPFDWAHNNTRERANGVRVELVAGAVADVHAGTGKVTSLRVSIRDVAPGAPQYEWVSDPAGCELDYLRADFKPGDGLYPDAGGGDDDGDASASNSGGGGNDRGAASSARRSCKSACKQAAGSCRTACHGASAQCASDCNHEENSCTRGC